MLKLIHVLLKNPIIIVSFDAGQHVHIVLLVNVFYGVGPGQSPGHPQFHVLPGIQAGTAAATEGVLADRVLRHLVEVVAGRADDVSRLLQDPHGPGRIAGIVERHADVVVAAGVQVQLAVPDQVWFRVATLTLVAPASLASSMTGSATTILPYQKYGCAQWLNTPKMNSTVLIIF